MIGVRLMPLPVVFRIRLLGLILRLRGVGQGSVLRHCRYQAYLQNRTRQPADSRKGFYSGHYDKDAWLLTTVAPRIGISQFILRKKIQRGYREG